MTNYTSAVSTKQSTGARPKVLVASYLEPDLVERIRFSVPEVDLLYRPDLLGRPKYPADHYTPLRRNEAQEAEWRRLLSSAEVLFDFDYSHVADLPSLAPNLRWIQATSAGVGNFLKTSGYLEKTHWVFTTASGVHARPLAEFAIMSMLYFAKGFPRMQRLQKTKTWERYATSELSLNTLGIVGVGKIGSEVARIAKAFGMSVIGMKREPGDVPNVDRMVYGSEGLREILSQSDFLCLSLPQTVETERMISSKELALMKKGAVIINVSRGAVIDEGALIEGLKSGHLGGAALDVFEVEPLPAESSLWAMENVIVSPHSASTSLRENEKLVELFCENLKRYVRGGELINVFDRERMY
jgi:phosphoglycerate dehydrogenase-like enzyme